MGWVRSGCELGQEWMWVWTGVDVGLDRSGSMPSTHPRACQPRFPPTRSSCEMGSVSTLRRASRSRICRPVVEPGSQADVHSTVARCGVKVRADKDVRGCGQAPLGFFFAMTRALMKGWKLTLMMMAVLPFIVMSMGFLAVFMKQVFPL